MRNRKYIVDLNSKTYQVARYKQYDNNINYSIEVIEDGVLVDLNNCIVKAFFETPSKLILQKDCMVSDNTITTILDNNILGEAGKVLVEFTIYKSDIIVTTFTLSLDVEKSINKNDAIQKEPVWDIIANLLEIDETVRIKLEEVDNKIIETTEITNTNTSKIDNKILDIQNQLDSRISEKFTEIDNTLESKTTEKFIAVDEILNEKQTQIQEQVDNKISDADNKILDCEERMQNIESNFGDLVDGTGYATTEFVNRSLEQKSNIDHRHNISEIDDLNMNAEDISMSDGSNVEENVYRNKENIQYIKNELSITENTSYTTANGVKEFECKDGYVDNVVIEGETLVNLFNAKSVTTSGDRLSAFFYYSTTTSTVFNLSDKDIIIVVYTDGVYTTSIGVSARNKKLITLNSNEKLNDIAFLYANGWTSSDVELAKKSLVILEGDHTDKSISYFEGLKSVGQGDKIEVLTRGAKENIFPSSPSWVDGQYVDGRKKIMPDVSNNASYSYCEQFIDISSYESLYLESGNKFYQFYDESKNPLGIADTNTVEVVMRYNYHNDQKYNNGDFIIKVPSNAKFIRVNSLSSTKDTIKLYGEYKYDKKQILTTLRSLPNGVKDTIEKRGNKYYKIKRCGEVVLNGGENWKDDNNYNNDTTIKPLLAGFISNAKVNGNNINIYCDKFIAKNIYSVSSSTEGIYYSSGLNIHIRVSKTKATDSVSFKTWLASNPVTVVYELETPIIEELPNFNPQTFSDKTTLLLNSGVVQGEASFEVTNSLGSELEVLKGITSDLIDNVVDEEVYYPKLLNGWTDRYSSNPLKISKIGNIVIIEGNLYSGTVTVGTLVFTIPHRFRPKRNMFVTICSRATKSLLGTFGIGSNGNIIIQDNGFGDASSSSGGIAFSYTYSLI